jgi:hypothetical protein
MKTQKKKLAFKKTAVSELSKDQTLKLVGGNYISCWPQYYTCNETIFDHC